MYYLDLLFDIFDASTMSITSPPPTLLFLRFCRLICTSPFNMLEFANELRDEDAGPGLLGGFADVAIKLLQFNVDDPIEE